MEQTWSTAGHGRGTAYVPSPRGVHPRQSGAPSALTPWVIPRVRPQRVRHWSKKPAALVTLAGAEAPRVSGSSETKTYGKDTRGRRRAATYSPITGCEFCK